MFYIALILDDIRSTFNVGSIFRTADCFGVSHIYISGITPYPLKGEKEDRLPHLATKIDKQIAKTALGAEKYINFSVHNSINDALEKALEDGYKIVALEQSSSSLPIKGYDPKGNVALVLGNEVTGLEETTLAKCNDIIEIKQYGNKESLNVVNAVAIALYELTRNN